MVVQLREDRDLEELLERSKANPILIFKHSTQCPISGQAHEEFTDFTKNASDLACGIVHAIESRKLSEEIAARFGIRHESPQVLLIKDGRVIWHASHWSITSASLGEALRAYAQPADQRN